ncbi:GCN5-related N-acetyltransferase [Shewanella denitrificans OS217]|jgi:[ribosomal protein S5]-alanine N-acetyltransferase|uniref:GCN5-related N-acetyltransferase n=1 Tax=Shewanella denitrificans (strain OS217 / ATCC BAA-1090 / DSM 15013) TaxID=318161 RepID=Q12R31_SHEDO|nr:GNAT family N-acetyltransferase [Shewanella denitrificans]ABE54095.1 GCN5-related N-acetyltransferase [Shewanella denitrificans OS217]
MSPLTTARLTLRPMEESDEVLFVELFCSDRIMSCIGDSFETGRAQRAFATTLKVCRKEDGDIRSWTVFCQQDPRPLGLISFSGLSQSAGADMGIMLSRGAHGKRIADEAVIMLADFGFNMMGLEFIRAEFKCSNLATKRITRKLGFSEPQQLAGKAGWQECFLYPKPELNV